MIAESGVHTRAQGAAAELAGADAILVGSALMQAPDPQAKLRELLSRPLVKVCGLTRQDDVDAAVEAGADLLGFILVDKSPRRARGRARRARHRSLGRRLRRGHDGDARRPRFSSIPTTAARCAAARRCCCARAARSRACSTSRGRSSDPAHWSTAAAANGRVVLAGGLGPDNVRDAIAAVRPWARRRGVVARARAGRQGSRQGARIRRGGAGMSDEIFGAYGGRYVPETLIPALDELERGWREALADDAFHAELHHLATTYAGRPTPLTLAERFAPGKRIYLKREDLLHTGAHKLNNALGQAVLARRLGKQRIVAETGAGQHGVATATVCARFGYECVVYMGEEDMRRQKPNVERMEPPRRRGARRRLRHEDAEGGDERGDPRLDHERRDDALPDRLVRRPGAVPGARRRAAVGDRPRGARADARRRGAPARGGRRVRRRRLERDRHLPRLRRRRGRAPRSASRRRARRRSGPAAPACCTARARRSSPTRTGRSPTRTRSPPGSTIRASARSTRSSATPAARSTSAPPTTRRSPRSATSRAPRGSSPRSSRRTRSRARASSTRS